MKYSKLFGNTIKQTPKDEESKNAQLLIKAGFIQKEMAGVYAFLPLGKKVLDKIINIIKEEMDNIGGQEIYLSSLQNPEVWKKTDRWNDEVIDVWFKTHLQNDNEIGLATTHEEPLTKILTHYVQSYKDLPLYLYQFQTKFRNELRARSGLLRTREFIMKDLYSFNKDEEGLEKFYQEAINAYNKIFERLGIGNKTFITFASGGPFSKYSHEFQTVCENGEDTIYLDKGKDIAVNKEVLNPKVLEDLDLNKETLKEVNAIEVGNIFKLGTKFSSALGLNYTDESGKEHPVIMGSYGIGPGRVMATVVELMNDKNGIIWPESISPYKIHLVGLNLDNQKVKERGDTLYQALLENDIDVLYDDREDISAGEKFADTDLIGIPYRLVISEKTTDEIEMKRRDETKESFKTLDEIVKLLK